ncbi:MAG: hypothetical protein U1E51_16980 [Candidatus Binatia bacterium]|nr:hypothetical protein [Candidatus Binatia bacterium]
MATKKDGVPCYDKAAPDEPLFVLRGQDELAEEVVEYWAHLASGGQPAHYVTMQGRITPKAQEALNCAEAMRAWPVKKFPD